MSLPGPKPCRYDRLHHWSPCCRRRFSFHLHRGCRRHGGRRCGILHPSTGYSRVCPGQEPSHSFQRHAISRFAAVRPRSFGLCHRRGGRRVGPRGKAKQVLRVTLRPTHRCPQELQHARARGARIYAEVKGYGASADAHHTTSPIESGRGALTAMKRALKNAGLKAAAVDYVNAHATSTVLGDAAENVAIKSLMLDDDASRKPADINVSSVKGAIGHLLGAAGAVEAIFTVLALHNVRRSSFFPGGRCIGSRLTSRPLRISCRRRSTWRKSKTALTATTCRGLLRREWSTWRCPTALASAAPTPVFALRNGRARPRALDRSSVGSQPARPPALCS